MVNFNIPIDSTIDDMYSRGLLPQRNDKNFFYQDSSSRSNLSNFQLSSENRRILNKTQDFNYEIINIENFEFNIEIQKKCFQWSKSMDWDFPSSSIKNVFTNHIFNQVYVWKFNEKIVAYSLVYSSTEISHIAYVFYDPEYSKQNLPIRLALEVIINSQQKNLKYCYLGRFSTEIGYYKRNMPGFEYYQNGSWIEYK